MAENPYDTIVFKKGNIPFCFIKNFLKYLMFEKILQKKYQGNIVYIEYKKGLYLIIKYIKSAKKMSNDIIVTNIFSSLS